MPKLSIIMPAYNVCQYIGDAIRSVFAQEAPDWELIVVDDGSTDDTAAIVKQFGDRVRYVFQTNQGLSQARNTGIGCARGRQLTFLDADDRLLPQFLGRMSANLDKADGNVAAICSGWTYIDESGQSYGLPQQPPRIMPGYGLAMRFPTTVVVRRSHLDRIGTFDPDLTALEDWDLWLRMLIAGYRILSLNQPLLQVRVRPYSLSRDGYRMRLNRLKVLDKTYARADLPQDFVARKKEAYGAAYVQSSANYYEAEEPRLGESDFVQALAISPDLVMQLDTFYSIACARQPVAFKGSSHAVDLHESEARLLSALNRAVSELSMSQKYRRRAFGNAYLTLARLAYQDEEMLTTRRYLARALMADVALLFRPSNVALLAESRLTPRLVRALRQVKDKVLAA
jgi:glycosyltransferase involved in cell wall biosynthesis